MIVAGLSGSFGVLMDVWIDGLDWMSAGYVGMRVSADLFSRDCLEQVLIKGI